MWWLHPFGYSRRRYVYTTYVLLAPLLVAALYIKFFPDELVSEDVRNSVVLAVKKVEGGGVGSGSSRVTVQLDSGEKSNLFLRMAPSVGQNLRVKVLKYESGEIDISSLEF